MPDFTYYTPSEGESKNDHEISGMYTYFVLSWKHDLTKGDYNLKAVQDIC